MAHKGRLKDLTNACRCIPKNPRSIPTWKLYRHLIVEPTIVAKPSIRDLSPNRWVCRSKGMASTWSWFRNTSYAQWMVLTHRTRPLQSTSANTNSLLRICRKRFKSNLEHMHTKTTYTALYKECSETVKHRLLSLTCLFRHSKKRFQNPKQER